MAKLNWVNQNKTFETGVDRGVLYSVDNIGVAWVGLVAVTESPSGGDPESFYIDGQKYLNYGSFEEFEGTIEAYTYPDEFAKHEGTASVDGLHIHQQRSIPFGLSYRTRIGNEATPRVLTEQEMIELYNLTGYGGDKYGHSLYGANTDIANRLYGSYASQGTSYAYKIHLVYNAITLPSDVDYVTQGEDTEALTFSWDFTTTPANVVQSLGNKPLSHISIRSDKTLTSLLLVLKDILYGTDSSSPQLPTLQEILDLFDLYSLTGYGQGSYGHVPYGGNTRLGDI